MIMFENGMGDFSVIIIYLEFESENGALYYYFLF